MVFEETAANNERTRSVDLGARSQLVQMLAAIQGVSQPAQNLRVRAMGQKAARHRQKADASRGTTRQFIHSQNHRAVVFPTIDGFAREGIIDIDWIVGVGRAVVALNRATNIVGDVADDAESRHFRAGI